MYSASIQKSVQAAVTSLQMEGLGVKAEYLELCRKMLAGEMTMEEYLSRVTPHEVTRNEL